MILAYLLLLTGLTLSAVAIYYSVVGLTAIFSAAAIPIIVMGSSLEIAKLVCASWLKANWEKIPRFMKIYMGAAVVVLMLITSMGIFGFLSKAHNDQNLVSGDVQSKIAIFDEKIKTAKENIDSDRKQLKQMDEAVDQVMARSSDEKGASTANNIRKAQQRDRAALAKDIETNQRAIAQLNDEAAPIRAEVRKVDAEVGPIKYIAAFIYGTTPDASMLERAVTWIIILIVVVFDPLAVIMLLGSQMTFAWHKEQEEQSSELTIAELDTFVGEKPTPEELHIEEDADLEPAPVVVPVVDVVSPEPTVIEHVEEDPILDEEGNITDLERWNKMIAEAEAEVANSTNTDSLQDRVARGETYIDNEGHEVALEADLPVYSEEDGSKKKTYMTKDPLGQIQIKNRD